MADSIQRDIGGPDWPIGLIVVASPGTPVGLMSVVDPANLGAPQTVAASSSPYQSSWTAQQIMLQGFQKGDGDTGLQDNTGNVYLMRAGHGGDGTKADYGSIVACIKPGQTIFLASAPSARNVFSPYRYFVDADNAGDAVLATLFVT